jgi:prepilin-type N-terminal cleavage/methylation domain-containing protein
LIDRFNTVSTVRSQRGFTLIEIIVTLILVGVSAAIMFPVLGTNLIRSAEPVNRLNDHQQLIQEMDKWTGIYRDEIRNNSLDITNFKTNVDSNANYLDNTAYINSFNGGVYATQGTNKIIRVTLNNNGQTLVALFAE